MNELPDIAPVKLADVVVFLPKTPVLGMFAADDVTCVVVFVTDPKITGVVVLGCSVLFRSSSFWSKLVIPGNDAFTASSFLLADVGTS